MGKILRLDGTEICKLLSFTRGNGEATAEVALEDEEAVGTLAVDVFFEDAAGQRLRGAVRGTRIHDSGVVVSVVLRGD